MPLRKLPSGDYLVKPPSRNLCVVISKPGGAVLYSDIPFGAPITLSVTSGHLPILKVHP